MRFSRFVGVVAAGALVAAGAMTNQVAGAENGSAFGLILQSSSFNLYDEQGFALSVGDYASQGGGTFDGRFSPDGTQIVYRTLEDERASSAVHVVDNAGQVRTVGVVPTQLRDFSWAPDGSAVVAATGGTQLWRIPVTGEGVPTTLNVGEFDGAGGYYFEDPTWSPDGTTIAFSLRYAYGESDTVLNKVEGIFTIPSAGGAATPWTIQNPDGRCETSTCHYFSEPDWSPDGSLLVVNVNSYDRNPYRREYAVATVASSEPAHVVVAGSATSSEWSDDGTQLLTYGVGEAGEFSLVDVANGELTPLDIDLDRSSGGYGFDSWQPCPTGTCAMWTTGPVDPGPTSPTGPPAPAPTPAPAGVSPACSQAQLALADAATTLAAKKAALKKAKKKLRAAAPAAKAKPAKKVKTAKNKVRAAASSQAAAAAVADAAC
jgi:Tol biopolymer transport system component